MTALTYPSANEGEHEGGVAGDLWGDLELCMSVSGVNTILIVLEYEPSNAVAVVDVVSKHHQDFCVNDLPRPKRIT